MKKVNNMTVFEPTDKCSLDEYSEKAATEVPKLIKKAKEEVNKKITEISENDIKQDNEILELKTNYTNLQEQNTKLESQIKKDRENMINLEVEGQSIHVEDSSDLEGQLEVLGNAEQDVREGYNLLNNSLTNRTVNGLTVIVNKDKSVTIKGTPTANATIKIDDTKNKNLPAGTYTLKDCQAYIESEENNGWWNGTETAATLTFNDTPTLGNHGFYLYFSSGIAVNKTYYPQLVAGPEEKPYEPYGASPSPEYPSEIRAVGDKGSVEIKKQNKNLLKNTAKTQTVNGVTFTVNEDGTVIANGTAVAEASLTINNQINLEKGEYCISGCPKGGGNNTYRIGLWNNTWESIALDLGDSSIFTLQEDSKAIKCAINIKQGTTVKNIVFKPQIEKGTKATERVEHQEENKILPMQKPMLEGDYFIKEADGWKEVHKWGKVILDGIKNKFTLKHSTIQTSTNGFYQLILQGKIKGKNGDTNNGICNYLKYIGKENAAVAAKTTGLWWERTINSNYASLPFLTLDEANKWLQEKNTEGNPVYICYKLETPTKIPCTPEQTKILGELDNFQTYKPVTNITTDSIAKLKLKYIADTKTYVDNKTSNLEQQVSVINQLLSTTKTSSVLLDNLQTDIESEVL